MTDDRLKLSRRTVLVGLGGTVLSCGETGSAGSSAPPEAGAAGQAGAGAEPGPSASGSDAGGASPGAAGADAGAAPSAGAGGQEGSEGGSAGSGGEGGERVDECEATSSLTPAQLLAKIEHVVVLCMENRSFDHFLGSLSLLEGRSVDGLVGGESNPDIEGTPVESFLLTNFTPADPPHEWDPVHRQWNGGQNDGFVIEHAGPSQNDVMGYHVRTQLPALYALADSGAVCDRYFSSLLGPTWPNRFYLHGGTSLGVTGNQPILLGFPSVFGLLDEVGISHKNYFHDIAWASGAYFKLSGLAGIDRFFDDCASGELPAVSLVDPQFFGAGANDDHPDHDIWLGQALISAVVEALGQSPLWEKCLLIVTYDEHGGFFDHVPPPAAADERESFRRLGFRVPTVLIGPHVRRGCTVSTELEHSSVLKTLVTRFGIRVATERVAQASDFSSAIDPRYLENPQPPPRLPQLALSRRQLEARPASVHHVEMARAAARLPRQLDRRSAGIGQTEHVLRWGQKLGVLRLEP
jgi:phospholipase C